MSSFIGGPHASLVHYIRAKPSPVAAGGQNIGPVAVFEADALLGVADVEDGLAHPRRVVAGAAAAADPVESKALSAL